MNVIKIVPRLEMLVYKVIFAPGESPRWLTLSDFTAAMYKSEFTEPSSMLYFFPPYRHRFFSTKTSVRDAHVLCIHKKKWLFSLRINRELNTSAPFLSVLVATYTLCSFVFFNFCVHKCSNFFFKTPLTNKSR